jgi:hypothetical protein
MTYYAQYDGYYTMSWHDKEENALKRWFDNFKIERYASFAAETEWLIVKEQPSETRRKKRYICEIGDDGRGTKREVIMDHTAPPAPVLTFAARRQYIPPPPKSAAELRKEAEWNRMHMLGYEPIRRPRMRMMPAFLSLDDAIPMMEAEIEYDIEWVRRRPREYYESPATAYRPPPMRHRRNV